MRGVKLFVNKVKYYQSDEIIGIARAKNRFIKYVKKPGYADIKLNVIIRGTVNNIIGEVQFLLKTMKIFKDKEHDIYDIKRMKSSIQNSEQILPLLMDQTIRLPTAGIDGNVSELCKLKVFSNQDLLMFHPDMKENILHKICEKNRYNAFMFLKSVTRTDVFLDKLFEPSGNRENHKPIELS